MANPDYDLQPPLRKVPPRPTTPPAQALQQPPRARSAQGEGLPANGSGPTTRRDRAERRTQTVNRTVTRTRTRNGGGFNPSVNPSLNISINKGGGGNTAGQGPGSVGSAGGSSTPGSAFMSNEDIHKFSEHIRKQGRQRATERAMDAEQLEEVLRHIPDSTGSLVGARMRARRVSRHLKRVAKAEQLIAKEAAALYAAFEREYEAELRKVSRGRVAQGRPAAPRFGWR